MLGDAMYINQYSKVLLYTSTNDISSNFPSEFNSEEIYNHVKYQMHKNGEQAEETNFTLLTYSNTSSFQGLIEATLAYLLLLHGLSKGRVMARTIIRRIIIAMHIHLREFFCSFFAF